MVIDTRVATENDARCIALAGHRTILDLVERLTTDFDCDVREGCDAELLPRLIAQAGMAFARMNEVKSERSEAGADFQEVAFKFAKVLLEVNDRVDGSTSELLELATCFFILCTAERQERLAIGHPFFGRAMVAIRRADDSESGSPTSLAAKILAGNDNFEVVLEFAAAMYYRGGDQAIELADCVFNHLLNQASMSPERRRAFIFLFMAWLPFEVEEMDLFAIRRLLWSSWVPQPLKLAMLSYCSPIQEYNVLPKVFGIRLGTEVREGMCRKLAEPVRVYLDTLLANAR